MKRSFETLGPTTIRIRIPAGHILVEAAATGTTDVEVESSPGSEAPSVEARQGATGWLVVVESEEGRRFWQRRSHRVRVRCPEGSAIDVKTASADLEARGWFGTIAVGSASGEVRVDTVHGPVNVHTASGAVRIDEAGGSVDVRTVSGEVLIDRCEGPARLTSASGNLRVGHTRDSVEGHSVSGDQRIEAASAGSVWLETISGNVEVGVVPGTDVWLDLQTLSGQAVTELSATDGPGPATGPVLEIRLKSLSGDLRVRRSAAQGSAVR